MKIMKKKAYNREVNRHLKLLGLRKDKKKKLKHPLQGLQTQIAQFKKHTQMDQCIMEIK